MKLSEIKGEHALDVLADIIDPVVEITGDEKVSKAIKAGKPKLLIAKLIMKGHKKSIITILALLNGEDPKTYEPSLIELPKMILELLSDEELVKLFQSQGQMMDSAYFGSATENSKTEEM